MGGLKDTGKGGAAGTVSTAKGTAQGGKEIVKRTVAGIKEDDDIDEMEVDDGWYAHREMYGDKGVSKDDWKKGIRMNRKGEKFNLNDMKKKKVAKEDIEVDEAKDSFYNRAGVTKGYMALMKKINKGQAYARPKPSGPRTGGAQAFKDAMSRKKVAKEDIEVDEAAPMATARQKAGAERIRAAIAKKRENDDDLYSHHRMTSSKQKKSVEEGVDYNEMFTEEMLDYVVEMSDDEFDNLINEASYEELEELVGAMARLGGKAVMGTAKIAGKGAMAAGRGAMKLGRMAAGRMSTQGRADAAERKTQKIQAKTDKIQAKMQAQKKIAQQKAAASLAKQKLKAVKDQAKKQRANMGKPAYASEEVEIEESIGLSTQVNAFLDDYEDIMERNFTMKAPKMDFTQGLRGKGKLDPVGKEDDDIDNDGDVDKSDKYLHNRRKAIKKAMKEGAMKRMASGDGMKTFKKKPSGFTSDQIKQAAGIVADKRYSGGNMTGAVKKMEKITPGISDHPKIQKQLQRHNEETEITIEEGAGDEKVRSAGQAAELAKHYYQKAKQAGSSGNSEVAAKYMSIAKKFYNKSDHMKSKEKGGHAVAREHAETFWSDEELAALAEADENPANVQHMCMKQVAHEQYGEGECVHGEHADPVDGEVAWYSVQFEHGIEIVDSNDLEVISEMNHGHKKKKMKEDYTPEQQEAIEEIEEARKGGGAKVGETERSGHRVTKSSKEEPEHIAMQLRKVVSVGHNHDGVHFDSGKQKVHPTVAQAALHRYNQAKPAEKEEMQKHMKHSPKALGVVAGGHDLSKSPAHQKKDPMAIDKTQSKRHGVRSASGHYN